MTFDFAGRVVLVTGAAQGIGLAIARLFLASGAQVWLADVNRDAVERVVGGESDLARALTCDVSDSRSVAVGIDEIVAASGRLDVVVNNAGILRDRVVWKLTDQDWSAVLGVHLTGTFNCIRASVPAMRAQGSGRIVNVTSYSGLHGNIGQANYAAAKAGIIGLTRTAAKELAAFGVTVNAISPNARTEMVDSIPIEGQVRLISQIPMGRFAEPDEMAAAVAFLASDEAAYITGVVLAVDGGLSI